MTIPCDICKTLIDVTTANMSDEITEDGTVELIALCPERECRGYVSAFISPDDWSGPTSLSGLIS